MFLSEKMVERIRSLYPVGTRLRCENMPDDPNPVPPGTLGTVVYVDDAGQIGMKWDNGRSLSLIYGVDSFTKIEE